MGTKSMNDKTMELVAERFRVLADRQRLKLLQALGDGERTVADLALACETSQANASKHLSVLLRAGLVARRKEGLYVYYRAADPSVFQLCDLVCGSIRTRLSSDLSELSEPGDADGSSGTGESGRSSGTTESGRSSGTGADDAPSPGTGRRGRPASARRRR